MKFQFDPRKMMTPRYLFIFGILGVAFLAVVWYLVSPLFINTRVNETFPSAADAKAQEPAAMKTAMAISRAVAVSEAMPTNAPAQAAQSPTLIASGDFKEVVHEGKGKAELFRLPDGSYLLRFEDFQVLNGPDLHVWLVPTDKIAPTVGQEIPGYLDLGKLKGNVGAQNYALAAGTDVTRFKSVVVWCQPFKVPFIAATLK